MGTTYTPAEAVEVIAKSLIPSYHPMLQHVDVRFVFRGKATKRAGRTKLGSARRVSGLNAFMSTGETDENEVPIRTSSSRSRGTPGTNSLRPSARLWSTMSFVTAGWSSPMTGRRSSLSYLMTSRSFASWSNATAFGSPTSPAS